MNPNKQLFFKRGTKGLLLLGLLIAILSCAFGKVQAAGKLTVMKSSKGTDLTYRNSSEKVYGLETYDYPTSEFRACWVSVYAGDIAAYQDEEQYKKEITKLLDNMVKMGMNAMVFHIRTHNNAMYRSDLNPIASWWWKVDFDEFDPLAWTIEESHKRGIEFHAWMNPYRITSTAVGEGELEQIMLQTPAINPGSKKENMLISSSGVILNPGIPEVRQFIVDTCMEVVERYDVDAIHFDDYFYISGVDDTATRNQYNTENLSLGDFRRKQVDLFIEELHEEMTIFNKVNQRCIQLGISPSGVYRNGGYTQTPQYDNQGNLISPLYSNTSGFAHYDNYLYSDTKKWIDEEWIDYIIPQAYWAMEQTGSNFYELTRWWSWAVRYKKVNLYMGVGIYMALESNQYWKLNANEVQNQLLNAGAYDEINGICFYKYATMIKTGNAIIDNGVNLITNDYWKKRVPGAVIQQYKDAFANIKPTALSWNSENNTITWDPVQDARGYMVYRVPKGTTLDPNNIDHIYQYIGVNEISVTNTQQYQYYVATVNQANVVSDVTAFDVTGEIDTIKQDTMRSLYTYVTTLGANEYELQALKQMLLPFQETIQNATTVDEIQNASISAKFQTKDFLVDLLNLKEIKSNAFQDLSTSGMNKNQLADYNKLKDTFDLQLKQATSFDKVAEVLESAQKEYDAILKRDYNEPNGCNCSKDLFFVEWMSAVTLLGILIKRKRQ